MSLLATDAGLHTQAQTWTETRDLRRELDKLVDDALLAQASVVGNVESDPGVSWDVTAALARRVSIGIAEDANALGAPTPHELASLTVVHAVVLRSPALSALDAVALASAIKDSVANAQGPSDFERRAQEVPHVANRVRVERIGPFTADGRMSDGSVLDPSFVAVAFSRSASSPTSQVFETPFGWHVLRLIDAVPPDLVIQATRSGDLAKAVLAMRARARFDDLVRARRRTTEVTVYPSAEGLMARLSVTNP